jgi:uncharacterized membrane protein YgaE (UPF0421/DUF939 family)
MKRTFKDILNILIGFFFAICIAIALGFGKDIDYSSIITPLLAIIILYVFYRLKELS